MASSHLTTGTSDGLPDLIRWFFFSTCVSKMQRISTEEEEANNKWLGPTYGTMNWEGDFVCSII
uniref:Uncharacterized protein n=1 Tax=Arundo donax TaxID=35708 RepID=A0A0A9CGT3_ARUDO